MSHPLERWPEFVCARVSATCRKNQLWVVTLRVPLTGFPIYGVVVSKITHHRGPSKLKAMNKALTYLVSLRLEGRS